MSKDVVIILSHADTVDKLEILDKCISEIKNQGYPVIISSHIELPDIYYNIADYIVYDKDNPLIKNGDTGTVYIWYSTPVYVQQYPLEHNHAYAVMKLIKNGLSVAHSNGYEKAHFVNYDYVLKDSAILEKHSEHIETADIFSYYYEPFDSTRRHMNTALFSVKVKPFLEASVKIKTAQDFLEYREPVFEYFCYKHYIEKCNLSIICDD